MFTLPECSSPSGMSRAGPQLDQRWTVDGVWLARYPHLRRRSSSADIRDNVSSRTRPHARSQVRATHRSLMYRVIGYYPVISPTVVVTGNQSAVDGRRLGAPPGHGGFEVGGGDEGADFGVQVKAELDLHLIGAWGIRKAA